MKCDRCDNEAVRFDINDHLCADCFFHISPLIKENPQLSKLLALLDEAKCPECRGEGYIYHLNKFVGCARGVCPTCKGTGQRYKIALVDTEAELLVNKHGYKWTLNDLGRKVRRIYKEAKFHKVIRIL